MFRLGGIFISVIDVLLIFYVYRRLRATFPHHLRRLRRIGIGVSATFVVVALVMSFRPLTRELPDWLRMTVLGGQMSLLMYALVLAVSGAFRRLWRGGQSLVPLVRRTAPESGDVDAPRDPLRPQPAPEQLEDPGRRRLVVGAAIALPAAAVAVSTGGIISSQQVPVVVRVPLPVRRDATELHGLQIVQVSDIHVGSYADAERLDEIAHTVNSLDADFHVLTGDLINDNVSQLELMDDFLRSLRPRRGQIFLSMGNHEYWAARQVGVQAVVRGFEESGAQMLIDEARRVRVGGDHFWLGGLDYPPSRRWRRPPGARSTRAGLERALGQMQDDGAPRIVLSHHPKTFVEARDEQLDLMLSGHTHGGQVVLGRIGDYALSPALAAGLYHNGTYIHRGRRLHVNVGAGGWLPFRINCPPEITLVELTSA